MPISYVYYELHDGYINNWLVAGPETRRVDDFNNFREEDFRQQIVKHYYQENSGINKTPVERGPLSDGHFKVGDYHGSWSYLHCREDHFVDKTDFYPIPNYLRSWAYAQVMSDEERDVNFVLTTFSPADLWLNGGHVFRQDKFSGDHPGNASIKVKLSQGVNTILVRFEQVALRNCPYVIALQICQANDEEGIRKPLQTRSQTLKLLNDTSDMSVRLPSTIDDIERRNKLEQVFEQAYLDRSVYGMTDDIFLRWPQEMPISAITTVRLQTSSGRIYADSSERGTPGDRVFLGHASQVPEGPLRVLIMPGPKEYYEGNRRITRELNIWNVGYHSYSEIPYGTYSERRQEALIEASRRENNVFAEIAKMAIGNWDALEIDILLQAIEGINQRKDGSVLDLLGVLGMVPRYGAQANFPEAMKQSFEACILNFRYWLDEPGNDIMDFTTESNRILFHACELLAGQLYPEKIFNNSGQTGEQHRQNGERLAMEWLQARGTQGFTDWDSNYYFAHELVALSHLIDLAACEDVWEMASVIMDKLLFTIALNSYKGTYGSSHGRASTTQILGGLLEASSGISRLMWGLGVFNDHIAGSVSMACMEKYDFPQIIGDIAVAMPEEMWNKEHQGEVDKVTYKTPDYMLCSVQDYHKGVKGRQEHIWQATLSPTAVVFVTHPGSASQEDAHMSGFWVGNAVLPRVAQWKDVLIAIHDLPDDDWMGFTHAYFPIYAMDETSLREDPDGHPWAFAKKGDGYLALTAANGINLIKQEPGAYRELRSYGTHNVWICQMGRALLDGDFNNFQEKVLALKVSYDDLAVRCETLRGEILSLSWESPLLRNEEQQLLSGFKHYENPYCVTELPCNQMEVTRDGDLLRLDFSKPSQ